MYKVQHDSYNAGTIMYKISGTKVIPPKHGHVSLNRGGTPLIPLAKNYSARNYSIKIIPSTHGPPGILA